MYMYYMCALWGVICYVAKESSVIYTYNMVNRHHRDDHTITGSGILLLLNDNI